MAFGKEYKLSSYKHIVFVLLVVFICLFFTSSALASTVQFPDLGVYRNHAVMTLVGFAHQAFNFDLFHIFGLHFLGLLFALIGFVVLILMSKYRTPLTVVSWVLLVFLVVVGPRASNDSIFFYDLSTDADVKAILGCPMSAGGRLTCDETRQSFKNGSAAGTLWDRLPESARHANGSFYAFVPQLVAIHFMSGIERTLKNALFAGKIPRLMSDGLPNNEALKPLKATDEKMEYFAKLYSMACPSHSSLLTYPVAKIDPKVREKAIAKTFSVEDVYAMNSYYYDFYANKASFHPIRAATVRLEDSAYAKSLESLRGDSYFEFTAAENAAKQDALKISLYRQARADVNTTISFPTNGGKDIVPPGETKPITMLHMFKKVSGRGNEYTNIPSQEPDPYNTKSPEINKGNGSGLSSPNKEYLWVDSDFRADKINIPSRSNFEHEMKKVFAARKSSSAAERRLADAILNYPVQIFLPYWVDTKNNKPINNPCFTIGSNLTSGMGGCGGDAGWRIAPRSSSANKSSVKSDYSTYGTGVQSCLDFAAVIQNMTYYGIEEEGAMPGWGPDATMSSLPDVRLHNSPIFNQIKCANVRVNQGIATQRFDEYLCTMRREHYNKGDPTSYNEDDCPIGSDSFCRAAMEKTRVIALAAKFGSLGSQVSDGISGAASQVANTWAEKSMLDYKADYSGRSATYALGNTTAFLGEMLVPIGLKVVSMIQGFVYGVYMKLWPMFVSFGLAIILMVTPFVFLMGLIAPGQAPAVLLGPILGILYLKTMGIALALIDYLFLNLRDFFAAPGTDTLNNISDFDMYQSFLVIMHLTASTMLFAISSFLLFGLRDPGAFVKQAGGFDKSGQISAKEAIVMAAPAYVAAKAIPKAVNASRYGVGYARQSFAARKGREKPITTAGSGGQTQGAMSEIADNHSVNINPTTGTTAAVMDENPANNLAAYLEGVKDTPNTSAKPEGTGTESTSNVGGDAPSTAPAASASTSTDESTESKREGVFSDKFGKMARSAKAATKYLDPVTIGGIQNPAVSFLLGSKHIRAGFDAAQKADDDAFAFRMRASMLEQTDPQARERSLVTSQLKKSQDDGLANAQDLSTRKILHSSLVQPSEGIFRDKKTGEVLSRVKLDAPAKELRKFAQKDVNRTAGAPTGLEANAVGEALYKNLMKEIALLTPAQQAKEIRTITDTDTGAKVRLISKNLLEKSGFAKDGKWYTKGNITKCGNFVKYDDAGGYVTSGNDDNIELT